MKRKADNDFQSVSGEGKPYALRKRIKLSEMENTRDTEMTSYEEKTSSGGRGEKRKADDDFQRVSGGGKSYALRKRIKVSEMENTRDTEMTSFQEKTSSGGRGEKRKADDAFQSVSGGGKPSAHQKRIKVTELENTREDADTEASSSGGRGVKRKADDDLQSVSDRVKPYALRKRIKAAETSSDENSRSGQSPVTLLQLYEHIYVSLKAQCTTTQSSRAFIMPQSSASGSSARDHVCCFIRLNTCWASVIMLLCAVK
nr:uncharacterized protein LOC108179511 isoform X2 [Danio rerio]|eukprot:XP_021322693.1 uncharacterized protein LOC108179511 isoform X2 [Danio rerio]